ncbi:MAG: glutathione peroxidase [Ignavibacteriales bacterium]|nr:glutathione peroxidase [Ignavibacteriales bacterium]
MKIKRIINFVSSILVLLTTSIFASHNSSKGNGMDSNIKDISVKDIDGKEIKLSGYKGKVLLIINVASECGYTPQYEGLQKIYEQYKDKGFEILAFPCNDFGAQEPGTNEEIKNFCSAKYNVTFKLFDKIKIIGEDKSPLYEILINNTDDRGDVKWNFEKFLIDKSGNIISRFRSKVKPESEELTKAVEELLK